MEIRGPHTLQQHLEVYTIFTQGRQQGRLEGDHTLQQHLEVYTIFTGASTKKAGRGHHTLQQHLEVYTIFPQGRQQGTLGGDLAPCSNILKSMPFFHRNSDIRTETHICAVVAPHCTVRTTLQRKIHNPHMSVTSELKLL